MTLLIDGYNLLYGTGLFGQGRAAGTLEAARDALLSFVASAVEPGELERTTIVFDSQDAPPGLPRSFRRHGILVRFASDHADADELLEELIAADHAPRKLTVVSSDHRVQCAARRRRAKWTDSHQWYFEKRQRPGRSDAGNHDVKPEGPYSSEEVAAYVREFETPLVPERGEPETTVPSSPTEDDETCVRIEPAESPAGKQSPRRKRRRGKKKSSQPPDKQINLDNPFPPGYAEDVLAEEGE